MNAFERLEYSKLGLYSSSNQNLNLREDLGAINAVTQREPSGGLLPSTSRKGLFLALAIGLIWFLILLVLLTCFGVAAVTEFRSSHKGAGLLLSIIEGAAGMISAFA